MPPSHPGARPPPPLQQGLETGGGAKSIGDSGGTTPNSSIHAAALSRLGPSGNGLWPFVNGQDVI